MNVIEIPEAIRFFQALLIMIVVIILGVLIGVMQDREEQRKEGTEEP